MSTETVTKHNCDRCRKHLPDKSNIAIRTEVNGGSFAWSRLTVHITLYSGSHNSGFNEPADLCKKCTITLLTDALSRVTKGERITGGIDGIDMLKFVE